MTPMRVNWVAGLVLVCGASATWAADGFIVTSPKGTSLKYFTQIDEHVFGGSKPTKDADFEYLRSRGIKCILEAKFLPGLTVRERKTATRYGMRFVSVPMNASPFPPMQRHVDEALRIMRTQQPVYIHCVLGRDRTGLLAGLYRIYFEGFSPEAAYRLMKKDGFRDVFFLYGLKNYFDRHPEKPADLVDLSW
jgi:protein-tyrosine phosphatase